MAQRVDVFELNLSFATLSSHNIYGPKGIGALLTSSSAQRWLSPIVVGGGQQNGKRGGTLSPSLCAGFAQAFELLELEGIQERNRVRNLRNVFVERLRSEKLGRLVGPLENRHPGNALIQFDGMDAGDLLARLQPLVAASSQSACSSGELNASHVLLAMGLSEDQANACIRFSFGRYSDASQVDELIVHIKENISDGLL